MSILKDILYVFFGMLVMLVAEHFSLGFLAGGLYMYLMLYADSFSWHSLTYYNMGDT